MTDDVGTTTVQARGQRESVSVALTVPRASSGGGAGAAAEREGDQRRWRGVRGGRACSSSGLSLPPHALPTGRQRQHRDAPPRKPASECLRFRQCSDTQRAALRPGAGGAAFVEVFGKDSTQPEVFEMPGSQRVLQEALFSFSSSLRLGNPLLDRLHMQAHIMDFL